jgi:hypothetical protein
MKPKPQLRAAQAAPETPRQKFLHRKIARRYAWQARDRGERQGRPGLFCYLRLCQLERLFVDRYGSTLPDDDAGRDDLYIAATHIAQNPRSAEHIKDWAFLWAPWISDEEIAALIARVLAHPVRFCAGTLGWRLRLTDAVRTRLEITTIAPIDCTKAARAQRTKERKAAGRKARRDADRAARPAPAAPTKPWEAAGISRRAWYYRKAKQKQQDGECNPDALNRSQQILLSKRGQH